jgi:preprotein translocase SecE subunit
MMKIFKEILAELKATTWPSRNTLLNLVVYTLITCGIITMLILGLDIFLSRVRDLIL